jgi:hypothetical protein
MVDHRNALARTLENPDAIQSIFVDSSLRIKSESRMGREKPLASR